MAMTIAFTNSLRYDMEAMYLSTRGASRDCQFVAAILRELLLFSTLPLSALFPHLPLFHGLNLFPRYNVLIPKVDIVPDETFCKKMLPISRQSTGVCAHHNHMNMFGVIVWRSPSSIIICRRRCIGSLSKNKESATTSSVLILHHVRLPTLSLRTGSP